ncbi:MAG: hypothetical protein ACLQJL_03765 [Roseiarcus sp.]
MRPIPIAQYLNQFGRAEPTQGDRARESVLLKTRILSTPADIDARVEEAFERGRREGLAAARDECEAAFAAERRQWDEREAEQRIAWQANEYAQLADKIEGAMVAIEDELARSVARILKPFLIEERVKQVTQALSETLSRILSRDAPAALKITGPEALLGVLRDRLASHPATVEYVEGDGVDVTVEAHHTIIKSQLQAWIDHIEAIGE